MLGPELLLEALDHRLLGLLELFGDAGSHGAGGLVQPVVKRPLQRLQRSHDGGLGLGRQLRRQTGPQPRLLVRHRRGQGLLHTIEAVQHPASELVGTLLHRVDRRQANGAIGQAP